MAPKEELSLVGVDDFDGNKKKNKKKKQSLSSRPTSSTVSSSTSSSGSATSDNYDHVVIVNDNDNNNNYGKIHDEDEMKCPSVPIGETIVLETADGAPYVLCSSTELFVNPTTPPDYSTPGLINTTFNMTIGLPSWLVNYRSKTSPWVLSLIAFLDLVFVSWWEPLLVWVWSTIVPVRIKRSIIFPIWNVYRTIHAFLLYKSTGLHPSVSVEYHALSTIMFWAQFLPIPPRRIRFSLGELHVVSLSDIPPPNRVTRINVENVVMDNNVVPTSQRDHCTVRGMYIHSDNSSSSNSSSSTTGQQQQPQQQQHKNVLFWIYGGAYLAGDCQGNSAIVDEIIKDCNFDGAFIPQFRLAPEATMDDVLWDVLLAYKWFCQQFLPVKDDGDDDDDNDGRTTTSTTTTQIVVAGVSSGGALALRLVQLLAERQRHEELLPSYLGPLVDDISLHPHQSAQQPCAVLMFGPYVDYTEPKMGAFLHHAKHDLVVSEAVQDYGLPYLDDFIPIVGNDDDDVVQYNNTTGRRLYSPVYRSMKGLPPLCFIVSEHEVTYDMTVQCVNSARLEGVHATIGVWKYMCHTFSFLQAFIPEGRLSMGFAKGWVKQQLMKVEH